MDKKPAKKKVTRKSVKSKSKTAGKPEEGGKEEVTQDDVTETTGQETNRATSSMSTNSMTGNRKISEKERKEIEDAFNVLDEDGDGKLGFEEMKKLLQSQFLTFTDAAAADVINELDEDGSGGIEFVEFEKYVIANNLCKPTVEEFSSEMKDAFQMFDSDNNGYIDASEFRALMGAVGEKMSEEDITEMMKEADTNGDGLIDYKEFCTHMAKAM